jgi:hypothetical protein
MLLYTTRGRILTALLLLVLTLRCGSAAPNRVTPASATSDTPAGSAFYVAINGNDQNDGSRLHPWRTISHAAESVGDGDTVQIGAGTYVGDKISATRGGTFAGSSCSSRVRFVGDYTLATRSWNTKIIAGDSEVWESNAPCIDLEGLDFSSTSSANGFGVKLSGRGDRLISSHVHGIAQGSCVLGGGKADYLEITGNWVHRCGASDHSSNLDHGIYVGNNHIVVANNVVYDTSAYCVVFYTTNDGMPSYGTISSNTMWNCKYGVGVNGRGADFNVITNNIVRDLAQRGGPGIIINNRGSHNTVASNLLWNISGRRYDGELQPIADLNADPLFIMWAPDGSGDYRLTPNSPARDSGTPLGAPDSDFLGNRRPLGAGFDRGAFEFMP